MIFFDTLRFLSPAGAMVTLVAIMLCLVIDTKRERLAAALGWVAWVGAFVCLSTALLRHYLIHP